jgi:beta-mannosidase
VDCLATYWLNGKELGTSTNAMIEHHFDVTGKLNARGANTLTVRLKSPIVEAARMRYDPAYTFDAGPTNQEAVWIRKPAHSYGWDIMPRAVSSGLWRPVELVVHPHHEITDMYFTTFHLRSDRARLAVSYELATDLALLPELRLKLQGQCGNSRFTHVHNVEFIAGRFEFEVPNPALWWPKGYGETNLYKVTTQLLLKDRMLASREDSVGIRKLEFIHHNAKSLEEPAQFLFKINGVPILCKGSNWVPLDAFHSRDAERCQKVLELAIDLGCNILRCWGGNVYEDDEFFDTCDRNGIMVWQDFALACAIYPETPAFLEVIRHEAISVLRKLRRHPCIVLYCGDNEGDMFCQGAGLDPARIKLTREVLPAAVFQCDPYRPYLPSSPYMSPEVIATGDEKLMPEIHLWGPRNYFKSRYYTEHTAPFVSEAGYDGCPSVSSLKRFLDAKYLWPWQNNAQWTFHSTNMVGDPYRIVSMVNQVKESFGQSPENLEDFILASQFAQAEALKFFIEMTRLKKWRRTGMIWWNVMDGWPQISDGVVDYYFNRKLAYYYIRRVQEPVCMMVDEPRRWRCRVVIGNDSNEDARGHYRLWDADTGKALLEGDYTAKANQNSEVGVIPVFHSDKRLFLMEWTVNGKRHVNHYLDSSPPFSLIQYKSWLIKIAALANDFDPASVGK